MTSVNSTSRHASNANRADRVPLDRVPIDRVPKLDCTNNINHPNYLSTHLVSSVVVGIMLWFGVNALLNPQSDIELSLRIAIMTVTIVAYVTILSFKEDKLKTYAYNKSMNSNTEDANADDVENSGSESSDAEEDDSNAEDDAEDKDDVENARNASCTEFIQYIAMIVSFMILNVVTYYVVDYLARMLDYQMSKNVTSIFSVSLAAMVVYHVYNWRNNINLVADALSYIYEFLASVLLRIKDKFATLDVRVAKYQTIDNYLVIFHILSGLFNLSYWLTTNTYVKNLIYVHAVVFLYQVLKYVYYNIYPELVKVIMDFIEWFCPFLRKFLHRLCVNIKWAGQIALISSKIVLASIKYVARLLRLFWIPMLTTVVVVAACVLMEVYMD